MKILNEMSRISKVGDHGDGVFEDPDNKDMVIIRNLGVTMRLPKAVYEAMKKNQKGDK